MFSKAFHTTFLGIVLAATLLVPAAQADDWARDGLTGLDPATAAVIQDVSGSPEQAMLDPAIRTALLERASSSTRPDDRPGIRGVGSLPQPEAVAPTEAFDWNVGISAGAAFAALLLALGAWLVMRHGRARITNA